MELRKRGVCGSDCSGFADNRRRVFLNSTFSVDQHQYAWCSISKSRIWEQGKARTQGYVIWVQIKERPPMVFHIMDALKCQNRLNLFSDSRLKPAEEKPGKLFFALFL